MRPPIRLQSIAGINAIPADFNKPVYRTFALTGYDDVDAMPVEHRRLVHEYTYEIYEYARQILRWRRQDVTVDRLLPLVVKYHHEGHDAAVRASYDKTRYVAERAPASG